MRKGHSCDVLIYCPLKADSVRYAAQPRRLRSETLLGYNIRRLVSGLDGLATGFAVLGHDDCSREDVAAEVHGTRFRHIVINSAREEATPGFEVIDDLLQAAQLPDAAAHFMVFPANCIFSDCELTKAMFAHHLASNAACTVGAGYPFGLLPVIFSSSALNKLPKFDFPTSGLGFTSFLEFLFSRFSSMGQAPEAVQQAEFARIALFPSEPVPASVCTSLPLRLLVEDRYTQAAAERVLSRPAALSFDSVAARAFKTELIAELETQRPSECRLSGARIAKPATVLFSTLRSAYSGPEQCLLTLMERLDLERFHAVLAVPTDCLLAERTRQLGIPVEITDFAAERCLPSSLDYWRRIIEKYEVGVVHLDLNPNAALTMTAHHLGIPILGHLRTRVVGDVPDDVYCLDRIIAISEFVAETLRRTYFNPSRISVIHDGVDAARFAAIKRNAVFDSGHPFRVAMVSRINPWKRQDLLIQAMALLKQSEIHASVTFFGDVDPAAEKYLRSLRQMVQEKELQDSVTFWGFESNLNCIYEMSDALVVCNSEEPLGTCVLEALASGMPAVIPNEGGSMEMVRHQEEGLLYDARDPAGLAASITRLVEDRALYQRLSLNARKRAQKLDISCHVERVQEIYGELLRDRILVENTLPQSIQTQAAGLD